MGMSFNESAGGAIKSEVNSYKYENGTNTLRIVGEILPRYIYWIEGENKKNIPFEALCFNREAEAFLNQEKDWPKEFYPDMSCSWGYVTQIVIEDESAECGYSTQVLNLKKKYWEQVRTAAKKLGDPTDFKTGWDLHIIRKKTGPLPINIEYQLDALECSNRPLNEGELEAIKDLKPIDEVMVRPTPDAQKELLERLAKGNTEETDEETIEKDFKVE